MPHWDIHDITKRVVGGQEATAHNWPSICSLFIAFGGLRFGSCGGTLVKNARGQFYVITAGHCVDGVAWSDGLAVMSCTCGIHNKKGDTPSHEQTFDVTSVEMHENYNFTVLDYDIAVLTLDHQPEENEFVQAACLPRRDHVSGERAMLVGWGDLAYPGEGSSVLQELSKPIIDDESCRKNITAMMKGKDFDFFGKMCAGHTEAGKGSCKGDSGGPLYTQREGRWTLTGVVSGGVPCAHEDYVDLYADVYSLRSWIDTKINN